MSQKANPAMNIFSSIFFLLFAVFIICESINLGLGEWNNPGPGYFSFGAALVLGIISLSVLSKELRKRRVQETFISDSEEIQRRNVVLVLAGAIVYVFMFDKIGFLLTTFLLMIFFLRAISPQRWLSAIIIAISCAVGSYLLFHILLSVEFPRGVLGL